jgi:hypothetical protein
VGAAAGGGGWDAVDVEAVVAAIPTAYADDLAFCTRQARAGNPFYRRWQRTRGPAALRARARRAADVLPGLRAARLEAAAPTAARTAAQR